MSRPPAVSRRMSGPPISRASSATPSAIRKLWETITIPTTTSPASPSGPRGQHADQHEPVRHGDHTECHESLAHELLVAVAEAEVEQHGPQPEHRVDRDHHEEDRLEDEDHRVRDVVEDVLVRAE